jgi:Zn finger protein HypA/HybF involved in hydrogenase expression
MFDGKTFEDALVSAVDAQRVVATCSGCAQTLSPDEHYFLTCLRCGMFCSDVYPLYSTEEA